MEYPVYNDFIHSGIDWLGEIPQNWKVKKLRYLFEFGRGLGITKSNLIDKGIPCINYGEIHSKYGFEVIPEIHDLKCVIDSYLLSDPNALLNKGDFIFADTSEDIEGSGNFSHLNSDIPTFAGYHTVIARLIDADIQFRYMAYLLDSLLYRYQIKKNVSGVKVFSITQKILKSSYAWIPPSEEQQKIANFLDYKTQQIDQLIEKKKALIEKLNEQRIAVITQAVTKGIDKNAKMKPSGVDWLGDVPEHWEVIKLRFLLEEKLTNGVFKKSEAWGSGIRIVNVFDVYVHNDIINEPLLDRVICDKIETKKFSAKHGDFFLVRSSLKLEGIGKSASIIDQDEEMVFECHLVRGRPDLKQVHSRFLNLFLNSRSSRSYFISMANTVTMTTIDQAKFKELAIPIPQHDEQKEIVAYIEKKLEQIDKMVSMSKQTVEYYEEYRSALITAAVTGKIDVRDFEIPVT